MALPPTINEQMKLAEQGWAPVLGENGKPEAWTFLLPPMKWPLLWPASSDGLPLDYPEAATAQ